jgi:hypothetical protein
MVSIIIIIIINIPKYIVYGNNSNNPSKDVKSIKFSLIVVTMFLTYWDKMLEFIIKLKEFYFIFHALQK